MKQLTILQRHKYYNDVLIDVIKSEKILICVDLVLRVPQAKTLYHVHDLFPELMAKRPKGGSLFENWWPKTKDGQQKRIAALRACIKETAPKKKVK